MASQKHNLTSVDLKDTVAVYGKILLANEENIQPGNSQAPGLYKRYFKLDNPKIIYGNSSFLNEIDSIFFSGYTLLAPSQRSKDYRMPLLDLEGQLFFDAELPGEAADGMIFIGAPDMLSIPGFMGNKSTIESDRHKGKIVRAFLLEGINDSLIEEMSLLVGWQDQITPDRINTVTRLNHPLIALDALRISIYNSWIDQIDFLTRWLIHPMQPAIVKIASIDLIGSAIHKLDEGSVHANKLIETIITGWEAEQFYSIDKTYVNSLMLIINKIKDPNQRKKFKALSNNYKYSELFELLEKLKTELDNTNFIHR